MLLRNAIIYLALFMCFSPKFYAQDFYYGSDGKVQLEISTQKILIQFNSDLSREEQLEVLSKQKKYLKLGSIQNLSDPCVSILVLKNVPNSNNVSELLHSLREEELVDYANHFLIDRDGALHGITNHIFLKLKSTNQESLLDHLIYDFQGVTTYTRDPNDELSFKIKVHKNRNALALANEIHEYGIFDYCEPELLRMRNELASNNSSINNHEWLLQNGNINMLNLIW